MKRMFPQMEPKPSVTTQADTPLIHVWGMDDDEGDGIETANCGVEIPRESGVLNYHKTTCPDCIAVSKKKNRRLPPEMKARIAAEREKHRAKKAENWRKSTQRFINATPEERA